MKIDREDIDKIGSIISIYDWSEFKFNDFILTGRIVSKTSTLESRVGRVLQVREEYDGEEAVLIRHLDDNIQFHVNQSYYTVQEKYIEELEEIFKDVHVNDKDDEFTIQGKEPEVGFYISERTEDEKMGLRRGSTIDGILDGGD